MIEAKPHTPEKDYDGPTELHHRDPEHRVGRQQLVDDLLREVHERHHTPSSELTQPLESETEQHDVVAYLEHEEGRRAYSLYVDPSKVPNIAKLTTDSKEANLLSEMELQESRVQRSIERDLGLHVTSKLLGVEFLGSEIKSEPGNGGKEKNVSSWVKYTLERGDRRNPHLDRRAVKAIGAILDREILETPASEIEKGVVLEDETHKQPEQVVLAADDYHLAEELTTGSHKTIDQLDEVIIRDRKKLTHRMQRIVGRLVEKARDYGPDHDGPHQPQPAV